MDLTKKELSLLGSIARECIRLRGIQKENIDELIFNRKDTLWYVILEDLTQFTYLIVDELAKVVGSGVEESAIRNLLSQSRIRSADSFPLRENVLTNPTLRYATALVLLKMRQVLGEDHESTV